MEEWRERLVKEQEEVKERLVRLIEFMNSEVYFKLSDNHKRVFQNQKMGMDIYLQALNTRLFDNVETANIPDYGMLTLLYNVMQPWKGASSSLENKGNNTLEYQIPVGTSV